MAAPAPPRPEDGPGLTTASGTGVILAAAGRRDRIATLQRAAAPRLAMLFALVLRDLPDELDPTAALSSLRSGDPVPGGGRAPTWVAPLGLDPGVTLARGGTWAEALGAWRQPTVVVLHHDQLETGRPAAMAALLMRWEVPLLGLIQWGGTWQPQIRRSDDLPWLGSLAVEGPATLEGSIDDLEQVTALAFRQRHRLLLEG